MIRTLFFSFMLCLACAWPSTDAHAQVIVEGININNLPGIEYCRVIVARKGLTRRVTAIVDYGQDTQGAGAKQDRIMDEANEKPREFYSDIGIINHMNQNGWKLKEIVLGEVNTANNNSSRHWYYFEKRPITSE